MQALPELAPPVINDAPEEPLELELCLRPGVRIITCDGGKSVEAFGGTGADFFSPSSLRPARLRVTRKTCRFCLSIAICRVQFQSLIPLFSSLFILAFLKPPYPPVIVGQYDVVLGQYDCLDHIEDTLYRHPELVGTRIYSGDCCPSGEIHAPS